MIELKLTYKEVQALDHLGVKTATEALKSYREAEDFLRTNLEIIGQVVRVIRNMDVDSKAYKYMKTGKSITNKLCLHEQSRTNFWTHHERSLEYCCSIGDRMEFLINHKDDKEVVEKFYPIYMDDMSRFIGYILLDLNNWFRE